MKSTPHALRIFITIWIVICFFADPLLEISTVRSLFLSRAVAEDQSFTVDRFAHASKGDLAYHGGHYYSGSMPGLGLIAAPLALIAEFISEALAMRPNLAAQLLGIFLFNAPIAGLSTILLIRLLSRLELDPFRARWLAFTMVLGTHLFFFTVKFFEYPVLFLIQLILVRALTSDAAPRGKYLLYGGILGVSYIINDLALILNALLILLAGGIVPTRARVLQWVMILVGATPAVLARMLYMKSIFGSFFANPYGYSASTGTLIDVYKRYPSFMDIVAAGISQAPEVVFDLTFGQRGLFIFAPICLLLFVLFMKRREVRWNRPVIAGLLVFAANFVFHFTLLDHIWLAGASWGPRYLLFSLAALTPVLAAAARQIDKKTLVILCTLSIAVTSVGVQYGYSDDLLYTTGLFFLGGPTTPAFRWMWLHYNILPTAERAALVMQETPRLGAYYAYTHISPFWAFLIVGLVIFLLWLPVIRNSIPSGNH